MLTMTRWLCILLVLGTACAFADADDAKLLEKYRKIYEDTTATYETTFRGATQAWPIDYIKALQTLQSGLQASGNLDGWETVNKELKRFREEPTLEGVTSSQPDLAKLQNSHRGRTAQLKTDRDARIEDLRIKYVSRLTELQREWTQEGNFDAAFAARDEIKRVGGVPERQPESDRTPSTDLKRPPERAAVDPSIPTDVIKYADGTEVTPPGAPLPTKAGQVFKTKILTRTEHSPWSSGVSVKLWDTSDKESDSFERDQFVGTVDGKVKSDQRYARAALRTTRTGVQIQDTQLSLQYYAKPAGGSGDPRMVTQKRIPIPVLESRTIYVDAAPVSIDSLSRSFTIGDFREHSKTVGNKFYGYIVTLLDANNNVLYQGASSSTLAKMATIPLAKARRGQPGAFGDEEDGGQDWGDQLDENDIESLRKEVEEAKANLKEKTGGQLFKRRGARQQQDVREAVHRLKVAEEALHWAEKERRKR